MITYHDVDTIVMQNDWAMTAIGRIIILNKYYSRCIPNIIRAHADTW